MTYYATIKIKKVPMMTKIKNRLKWHWTATYRYYTERLAKGLLTILFSLILITATTLKLLWLLIKLPLSILFNTVAGPFLKTPEERPLERSDEAGK